MRLKRSRHARRGVFLVSSFFIVSIRKNRESGSCRAVPGRPQPRTRVAARLTSARSPRSACRVRPAPGRSREMGTRVRTSQMADGHPNRSDPRSPLPGVLGIIRYAHLATRSRIPVEAWPRGAYTYTIHNDKNGPGAPPPPTQAGRAGTSRGSTSCAPSLHRTYVADGVYSSHDRFEKRKEGVARRRVKAPLFDSALAVRPLM
jgi:hypothetical protein